MPLSFLPFSKSDIRKKRLKALDVIIVTGDAYVDHPSYGAAIIGRVLEAGGFSAGIIAQPDWRSEDDFTRLGRPNLFFGVTAGNLDSMVANYTANKRRRRSDAYSPGDTPGMRPDRALIVYTNRLKEMFPGTPVVLGGIEASLRRLAHYDYWDNAVRRSVLVDAKADMLVYGMGEYQAVQIAAAARSGRDIRTLNGVRGTAVIRKRKDSFSSALELPSFQEVSDNTEAFNRAYRQMYSQRDPSGGRTLIQEHGGRYVVCFPPPEPLSTAGLDSIYRLPFTRLPHPVYKKAGGIKGFETVKFSIISNRGCCGECSFCALSLHQGRIVQSRSPDSIYQEARRIAQRADFTGTITDIGGPTANLYGAHCKRWKNSSFCSYKKCLFPRVCAELKTAYPQALLLYKKILIIPGVKHVFISSGFRFDLLTGPAHREYLERVCARHISGRMKVAPEHVSSKVLRLMGKPSLETYERFLAEFRKVNSTLPRKCYLVNYFLCSHPGTSDKEADELFSYLRARRMRPQQAQDFTPLPMTRSAAMYYTGKDPLSGEAVYVPRTYRERKRQKRFTQQVGPKAQRETGSRHPINKEKRHGQGKRGRKSNRKEHLRF